MDDLKVLLVSSEVTPFSKSGGLGDVVGSLPLALKKLGVDVRIVFPKFRTIREEYIKSLKYIDSFSVSLGWRNQGASIFSIENDVPTYLIENDYYFGRDGLYGYGDDFERFAFFSKASVEFLSHIDFYPDIIHFNDWQTGLGSVYLKDLYARFVPFSKIRTVYTIHNIQYQGICGREILNSIDLNDGYFSSGKLEFYGNVSYMKAGLVYADAVTTVSDTYAEEIKTPAYSYGMDGILRERSESVYGIVNGIDVEKYNPKTDKRIYTNFDVNSIPKKAENKTALQNELGLPQKDVPIISMITRLVDQKGLDIVNICMEELVSKDIQLVILGTGDGRYENMFKSYAARMPDKVSANIMFDETLAQKIYAASDMFLMPSMFEPCGLGQLFAMRYGTVPIVRKTGGLADTVKHYDAETKTGNGFVFEDYVASGMMWAINEALAAYSKPREWNHIVKNAMSCDFSWLKSAEKYIDIYEKTRCR